MIQWFMENWLTITLIAGGFYLLVGIIEKIVVKRKKNKIAVEPSDKPNKAVLKEDEVDVSV